MGLLDIVCRLLGDVSCLGLLQKCRPAISHQSHSAQSSGNGNTTEAHDDAHETFSFLHLVDSLYGLHGRHHVDVQPFYCSFLSSWEWSQPITIFSLSSLPLESPRSFVWASPYSPFKLSSISPRVLASSSSSRWHWWVLVLFVFSPIRRSLEWLMVDRWKPSGSF